MFNLLWDRMTRKNTHRCYCACWQKCAHAVAQCILISLGIEKSVGKYFFTFETVVPHFYGGGIFLQEQKGDSEQVFHPDPSVW
jgi:hypothetical protein